MNYPEAPEFIFIGCQDYLLVDLCTTLLNLGFQVSVVAPGHTRIAKLKGLKRLVQVPADDDESLVKYLEHNLELLESLSGVFTWYSDAIMRLVANSTIPDKLKRKILPSKTLLSSKIFDSKVGQLQFFQASGVAHPTSFIASDKNALRLVKEKVGQVFIKSDRGSGGRQLKVVDRLTEDEIQLIPENWFPVVVQNKIDGQTIGVEAFYLDSELIFWLYSTYTALTHQNGPSMSRIYINPAEREFVDTLVKLGKVGKVSGFINVGLVKDSETGRFLLIEYDARPTVWHFAFDYFGMDLKRYFSGEVSAPLYPELVGEKHVYEPYRLFAHSVSNLHLARALKVLLRREIPGFGEPIPNSFYTRRQLIRRWVLFLLFPVFRFRYQLIGSIRWLKRRMRDLNPR